MMNLEKLDDVLTGMAKLAWSLRGIADEAVARWDDVKDTKRRTARASSVAATLGAIVGDYRLHAIYSAFLSRARADAKLAAIHERSARRFLGACLAHRGAFLKIGQMLSSRPDLMPAAWIDALAPLQDDVPAEPWEAIKAVVDEDVGLARFESFDETPIAAASIGQVHRAVALDGTVVAVKVQRPGIGAIVEDDLALLELFLGAMEGVLPPADYETISREVRDAVGRELDYDAEADAMARMSAVFNDTPGVVVPRPIAELSGPRVLTSTFIEGKRLAEAVTPEVLGRLLEVYLTQILVHGFYQADPHPGNFLVTDAGELVLLDFGCSRELSRKARLAYLDLMMDFVLGDRSTIADRLAELGFETRSGGTATLEVFAEALLSRFRDAARGATTWPTREELLAEASGLMRSAEADPVIRIPADFVMIARVFGTLGGLFLHHKPALDWTGRILPILLAARNLPADPPGSTMQQ